MPTKRFSQGFQGCFLVSTFRHEALQRLAEMPLPMAERTHRPNVAAPDFGCEHRPGTVPTERHRLPCDIEPALVPRALDSPPLQWLTGVHHGRQADDLRDRLDAAEDAWCPRAIKAAGPAVPASRFSSDTVRRLVPARRALSMRRWCRCLRAHFQYRLTFDFPLEEFASGRTGQFLAEVDGSRALDG